jgi:hypothetical protein
MSHSANNRDVAAHAAPASSKTAAAPAFMRSLQRSSEQGPQNNRVWDEQFRLNRSRVCATAVSLHTRAARGGDDGCVFRLQNVS